MHRREGPPAAAPTAALVVRDGPATIRSHSGMGVYAADGDDEGARAAVCGGG